MGFEYIYGLILLTVPLLEIAERELASGHEPEDGKELLSGLPEETRQRIRRIGDGQSSRGRRRKSLLPGRGKS